MKRSIVRGVSATLLAAAALAGSRTVETQAPPPYSVRFLPSLGGVNSRANSINNDGAIAGYSHFEALYRHATLWTDQGPIDLGALGSKNRNKNSNVAWPVKNTRGMIVGISQTDAPDPFGERWSCWPFFPAATSTGYKCLGFVWENGVMQPLPTLGGTHSYAAAANNLGQIVGWAETTIQDPEGCEAPQLFQFRGVVWGPQGKSIRELPLVPGDTSSAATAINDGGQIVGISGECDQAVGRGTAKNAVLWDGGTVTTIGSLGGELWNTPTAINEHGDIVGFSDRTGDQVTEAFLWTRETGMIGLGFLPLPGHVYSEAHAINASRQVVGLSCTAAFSCRAFLWQNGAMTNLNDLVSLNPGETLNLGLDINDAGVIVGRGSRTASNDIVAYVATPTGNAAQAALAPGTRSGRPAQADMNLTPDAARQLLSPSGPGRARLDASAEKP